MRYIRAELIRVLEHKRFYIVNFLVISAMLLQAESICRLAEEKERLARGYWFHLVNLTIHDQRTVLFFAVVSGTVYAASLREDFESRFYYPCFCRERRMDYIKGKIAVNFCAVNLLFITACFLCAVKQFLFLSPQEILPGEIGIMESVRGILSGGITYLLYNFFWSSFAMTVSYTMKSMYLSYLAPFIGFYILVIMNQRFFKDLKIVNPYLWVLKEQEWYGGKYGQWLFLLLLCAAVNSILAVIVYKRYGND